MSIEVKYPSGYMEKINFWQTKYYIALGKGVCAQNDENWDDALTFQIEAVKAYGKLDYYTKRQKEVYGN
jgi:hypothetical protein